MYGGADAARGCGVGVGAGRELVVGAGGGGGCEGRGGLAIGVDEAAGFTCAIGFGSAAFGGAAAARSTRSGSPRRLRLAASIVRSELMSGSRS